MFTGLEHHIFYLDYKRLCGLKYMRNIFLLYNSSLKYAIIRIRIYDEIVALECVKPTDLSFYGPNVSPREHDPRPRLYSFFSPLAGYTIRLW